MPSEVTQPIAIDGTHLLDEHFGGESFDFDLRSEGRRPRTRRSRGYQHDRTGEDSVRLHHNPESLAALFVADALG